MKKIFITVLAICAIYTLSFATIRRVGFFASPVAGVDYSTFALAYGAAAAGDTILAAKITKSLKKDLEQQISYYNALDENKSGSFDYVDQSGRGAGDKNAAEQFLMRIMQMEQQFKGPAAIPNETGNQIINQPVAPVKPADSPKK